MYAYSADGTPQNISSQEASTRVFTVLSSAPIESTLASVYGTPNKLVDVAYWGIIANMALTEEPVATQLDELLELPDWFRTDDHAEEVISAAHDLQWRLDDNLLRLALAKEIERRTGQA